MLNRGNLDQHWSSLRNLNHDQTIIGLAAILTLISAISISGFLTVGNLANVLRNASVLGIFSLGMMAVVLVRNVDLSQVAVAMVSVAATVAATHAGIPLGKR